MDGAAQSKAVRELLGDAKAVELSRLRAAAGPLYTARNWSKAHALIARGLKLDAKAADLRLWAGAEAFDTGNTKAVWIYDMRTNMPSFGKTTPLKHEHFADGSVEWAPGFTVAESDRESGAEAEAS